VFTYGRRELPRGDDHLQVAGLSLERVEPFRKWIVRYTGPAQDIAAGKVLTVCPTKIPMPSGATFINEGLAQFTLDGKDGFGIAEYWQWFRS
jgi:hypothetical protein